MRFTLRRTDRPDGPSRTARPNRALVLSVILGLIALVAAACSSGSTDDTAESSAMSFDGAMDAADDAAAPQEAGRASADDGSDFGGAEVDASDGDFEDAMEEPMADDAEGGLATGAAGSQAEAQLPDLGRDIIFTAWLEVGATDVSAATREAIRSVEARGGFLFSQETQGGAGGRSTLTFKVLPDQFQAALNDLGSVGDVRSQSISADDVTAVVVDLESRINTAEASVERLRNLLDDASELETIATLENQLLQRETTLEQLRGQLRTVRNQVDLATITLVVTELTNRPGLGIETMAYAGHDAGFGCFDSAGVRSLEAGDAVTVCYRLTNTGDTPLVDLRFEDPTLGASLGSMVVVNGSTTQLEPGDQVLLAQETALDESVRVRTSVTATGLDADGNELEDEVRATAATVRFDVMSEDDGFPSFGEVLSNSWNALVTAAVVIALVAVAVAPFALVLAVLALPIWLWMRRRRTPARTEVPAPPAPPAPTTEGASETADPADAEIGEKAATTS